MNMVVVCGVAIVVIVVAASRFNWKKWWHRKDITVPAPTTKRGDLYFGFYGSGLGQIAETRGSVNLYMESQWHGLEVAVENIRSAGVAVMLDVSQQVFYREQANNKFRVRTDATEQLSKLFDRLRDEGLLHTIKVVYPVDEPNNTVGDEAELRAAVRIIRLVCDQYAELRGYKLATTYAADKKFIAMELFDWVGFDDYDMKSSVLTCKQYKDLVADLMPDQRTMLIPGAAYGQDPTPFVNYAQTNAEVAAVLSFLWCDERQFDVGAPGARSNGLAQAYLSAGKSVVEGGYK